MLNRGKVRVQLDLKTFAGRAAAREYVSRADVVVHNAPPGRMERWGLGAAALRARHPRLVYLHLPGFASGDDAHAALGPAHEAVILGAAGVFVDMGLSRTLQGINPSYSPLPLASGAAGVLGAASVAAALFARERTGRGDAIEVPIASALLDALCFNTLDVDDLPARYFGRRQHKADALRRDGLAATTTLSWAECEELLDPFFKTYYCADGRPFYLVAMGHLQEANSAMPAGAVPNAAIWLWSWFMMPLFTLCAHVPGPPFPPACFLSISGASPRRPDPQHLQSSCTRSSF